MFPHSSKRRSMKVMQAMLSFREFHTKASLWATAIPSIPPGSRPLETFYARFGANEAQDAIRRASVICSLEHEGRIAAKPDFICLLEAMRIVDVGNHTLQVSASTPTPTPWPSSPLPCGF